MSQKDYAEARGWSKQYVNQLVKKGRIRLIDGLIDPDETDAALGRTRDPTRAAAFRTDGMDESGTSAGGGSSDDAARVHGSFAKARTVREHYRALRERLEYEQAAGALVLRHEVEAEQFTIARMTRDRLLQGAHELASTLAADHKLDEGRLRDQLMEHVVRVLNDVADQMADPGGEEETDNDEGVRGE